jgi:hypothetical protein
MNSIFTKYGKYFEPLVVAVLIAVFVIPIASVVNLSPQSGISPNLRVEKPRQNVLGANDINGSYTIQLISGTHNIITIEKLEETTPTRREYSTKLQKRESGVYSKPIIEVINQLDKDLDVTFQINDLGNSSSQIGVLYNNTNYVLKTIDGITYHHTMKLKSGEKKYVYLHIRDDSSVNFSQNISIDILTPEAETHIPDQGIVSEQ